MTINTHLQYILPVPLLCPDVSHSEKGQKNITEQSISWEWWEEIFFFTLNLFEYLLGTVNDNISDTLHCLRWTSKKQQSQLKPSKLLQSAPAAAICISLWSQLKAICRMCRLLHNLWVRCGRAAAILTLLLPSDHETLQYPPLQQGLIVQHSCDADRHTSPLHQSTGPQNTLK